MSTLQSRIELEFGVEYPFVGGLSGILMRSDVSFCLNRSKVPISLIWTGKQFQSRGPITANELSNRLRCPMAEPFLKQGTLALMPVRGLLTNSM